MYSENMINVTIDNDPMKIYERNIITSIWREESNIWKATLMKWYDELTI